MAFPTSPECIAAAEAALQSRLPLAWRERLIRTNGGELVLGDEDWQVFPVQDAVDRKRVGRTASHLVRETVAAREWRGFPAKGVAIAENGFGDYLVLLPDPSAIGTLADEVYRWDHETADLVAIGTCQDIG